MEAVFEDWRTAPVGAKVRAALGLLETLTLRPDDLGPADIAPLRAAGVSDEAIEDAIVVGSLFNVIDRVADGLGFEVPTEAAFDKAAGFLLKRGYR